MMMQLISKRTISLKNLLARKLRGGTRSSKRKSNGAPKKVKESKDWRTRLIKYLILAVVVLVILSIVVNSINIFNKYLQAEFTLLEDTYSIDTTYTNRRNHIIYILSDGAEEGYKFVDDIYLISIDYLQSSFQIYRISEEFVVGVPYLNQRHSVGRVYNNAVFQEEDPYIATNSAIKNLLGISINGYTFINLNDVGSLSDHLGIDNYGELDDSDLNELMDSRNIFGYLSFLNNFDSISNKLSTTLDKSLLTSTIYDFYNFRFDGYTYLSELYGNPDTFSFGDAYHPDYVRIDDVIANNFSDKKLLAEQVKVEVFNGTDIPYFASRTARLLENYGVNVVRATNAPRKERVSKLYVREGTDPVVNISTIKGLVKLDIEVVYEEYDFNSTGDIVLVLGDDLGEDNF